MGRWGINKSREKERWESEKFGCGTFEGKEARRGWED